MLSETNARRGFPCFDEPQRKAVFQLSLRVPHGNQAISNMPLMGEPEVVVEKQWKSIYHFQPTPKMATYLLAWVVAPLRYVSDKTKDGIEVRVYGVDSSTFNQKKLLFPLAAAKASLEFYNGFFGGDVNDGLVEVGVARQPVDSVITDAVGRVLSSVSRSSPSRSSDEDSRGDSGVLYPLPKLDLIAFDSLDCMAMVRRFFIVIYLMVKGK